jgi:hypothetical protein
MLSTGIFGECRAEQAEDGTPPNQTSRLDGTTSAGNREQETA